MSVLFVLLSLISAYLLTRQLIAPNALITILDHPNERSLHEMPTPRTGGIAVLLTLFVWAGFAGWWFGGLASHWPLWAGALLVAVISLFDDLHSLGAGLRFLVHLLAAGLVVYGGYAPEALNLPGVAWLWPSFLAAIFTVVLVVWMINLYNFMDGMDGFAGGMCIFGFGAFAVLGWMGNHELFMVMSLLIASATAGFLVFNFPPAKIFMGDTGASTLGFLVAAFSLWGAHDGVFQLWIALLVFSPFIVDATVTLLRRALKREKIWQAHKSHYYQRMVELGFGHKKTVLWEYVLMFCCAIFAIWLSDQSVQSQWVGLMAWGLLYIALMCTVSQLEKRHAPGAQP